MRKVWAHCVRHDKWYNAAKFTACYHCSRERRANACVECGRSGCNGICLDIAIERMRGVR